MVGPPHKAELGSRHDPEQQKTSEDAPPKMKWFDMSKHFNKGIQGTNIAARTPRPWKAQACKYILTCVSHTQHCTVPGCTWVQLLHLFSYLPDSLHSKVRFKGCAAICLAMLLAHPNKTTETSRQPWRIEVEPDLFAPAESNLSPKTCL